VEANDSLSRTLMRVWICGIAVPCRSLFKGSDLRNCSYSCAHAMGACSAFRRQVKSRRTQLRAATRSVVCHHSPTAPPAAASRSLPIQSLNARQQQQHLHQNLQRRSPAPVYLGDCAYDTWYMQRTTRLHRTGVSCTQHVARRTMPAPPNSN